MSLIQASRRSVLIAATFVLLLAGALTAYYLRPRTSNALPQPGSPQYEAYDDAFQRGVAGLDGDLPQVAEPSLSEAIELIPEEPAAWANRGLLYLRTNQLDKSGRDLEQAEKLAPGHPGIAQLMGLLEQARGKFGAAAAHFRRAIEDRKSTRLNSSH